MNTERVYNFSPGPAVLPESVLNEAKENLLNFHNTGLGVMEMSHRGKEFEKIIGDTENLLRTLLGIPNNYRVLFTTGGATMQFSMVPMNFLPAEKVANFILTGVWAEAAFEEAKKFGRTHIAGSSKEAGYRHLPSQLQISEDAAYVHFTSNNTVIGSQFSSEPNVGKNCLVCDASSDLLHKQIDVSRYGLIYAGAQKNLGIAGVTVVIVKDELLQSISAQLPLLLDFRTYEKSRSLHNTPPTFPIYILSLVLQWLKNMGGLNEMEKMNRTKAQLIYDVLDKHDLYEPYVEKNCRSLMNITFRLAQRELEERFIQEAEARGLHGLKGHRLVGGLRASIYNAFPQAGAESLAGFMQDFAQRN